MDLFKKKYVSLNGEGEQKKDSGNIFSGLSSVFAKRKAQKSLPHSLPKRRRKGMRKFLLEA